MLDRHHLTNEYAHGTTAKIVAREPEKPVVTVTATSLQSAPGLDSGLVTSERSGSAQYDVVKPEVPDGGTARTHNAWEIRSVERADADHHSILLNGVGREGGWAPYWLGLCGISTQGSAPPLPPYFWRKFRNYFVQNLFDETPPTQTEIDAAQQAAPTPASDR